MMFLRLRDSSDRTKTFPITIYTREQTDDGVWLTYTNEFGIDGNVIIAGPPPEPIAPGDPPSHEGWDTAYIMNNEGHTIEIIS